MMEHILEAAELERVPEGNGTFRFASASTSAFAVASAAAFAASPCHHPPPARSYRYALWRHGVGSDCGFMLEVSLEAILEAAELKCVRRVADTPSSSVWNGGIAIAITSASAAASVSASAAFTAAAVLLLAAVTRRGHRPRYSAPLAPADRRRQPAAL